ncbi:MAG: XrtA system polysaccharide chain length determinant [Novosphingobium sp.]
MNSIFDELRSAVYSVWHRRWVVLAVAWAVCLLGWLVVATIPNSYESKARIFVHLDDPLAEQIGVGVNDRKRDVARVRQTLTGAVNLEKVVRSTRLGDGVTTPKQMESVIQSLSKKIKVESEQDNLFKITALASGGGLSDAETAKLAQDIVQKMIDIFREEDLAGGTGQMGSTIEFMDQQLASRQKQLEEAEKKRTEFEARYPELAQGGASVLQRLEASRSELRGIDADLAAAQSALAAINGQIAGTPQTIQGVGVSGGAKGALAEAQGQLAGMRARGLTDNHPDVITLKNQIASLRAAAANEGGPVGQPNPAYSSLVSIRAERQANVQALQSRRASVQTEMSQIMSKQIQNPEVAAEAQRISRDYDVLKQQYDKLLADRESLRLRGQVENEQGSAKFQIIDPPSSPRGPSAPNRPLLLFAVLLVGIGAGVGAAFAVGQLRSTFATTAKLERSLGLPVLGAISQTLNEAGRALRRKRMKQFYAGAAALVGVFVLLLMSEMIQVGMVA